MRTLFISVFSFVVFTQLSAQRSPWEAEMIAISEGESDKVFMASDPIFSAKWDQLAQPIFWREIMLLSPDSMLVNIASDRRIVARMSSKRWQSQTDEQKTLFRDSVRRSHGLPDTTRILVTTGKNDFYRFDLVYPSLSEGVVCFDEFGVDPWYAQSILLIESPGQLKKSTVGAYGPFQLMPAVARSVGLTVNKTVDERQDFKRSAYGAAQLIRHNCIPSARSIAAASGLTIDENAIWFRLLVLHVYHAGAKNVRAVATQIGQVATGDELIRKMWVTTAADFGNSSQNYSQLALAAHLQLAQIIQSKTTSVYRCIEAYSN